MTYQPLGVPKRTPKGTGDIAEFDFSSLHFIDVIRNISRNISETSVLLRGRWRPSSSSSSRWFTVFKTTRSLSAFETCLLFLGHINDGFQESSNWLVGDLSPATHPAEAIVHPKKPGHWIFWSHSSFWTWLLSREPIQHVGESGQWQDFYETLNLRISWQPKNRESQTAADLPCSNLVESWCKTFAP